MAAAGAVFVRVLLVFAAICGLSFIMLQFFDQTRNSIAAQMLKPIPALCAAFGCFIAMSAMISVPHANIYGGKSPRASSSWRSCRIDTWCLMFGIGFLFFAAGDVLLSVHVPADQPAVITASSIVPEFSLSSDNATLESVMSYYLSDSDTGESKFEISGVSMFAVGQLALLLAMFMPRLGERLPVVSRVSILVVNIVIGVVIWATFVSASVLAKTCLAPIAMAALLATYYLIVLAVAWRATDVAVAHTPTGSRFIAIGAYVFLVSDLIVGSNTLCHIGSSEGVYYLLVMSTYYFAILMEAHGVTKFAIETWYMHRQAGDLKA